RHRQAKVKQHAKRQRLRVANVRLAQVSSAFDRGLSAELVAIDQALYGDAVIGEGHDGFVPMDQVGFDLPKDSAHAVVDGWAVSEANHDVAYLGLELFAGQDVEVFSDDVAAHEYRHVHAEPLVGFTDDFHHI